MVAEVIKRRKCKEIKIGNVKIGRGNPVVVQAMTKTPTCDLSATTRQIKILQHLGAQIVRVAVKDKKDATALKKIKKMLRFHWSQIYILIKIWHLLP